jgi:hypothetical protein
MRIERIKLRAKEPTTWAGLALILQAVAPLVPGWGGVLMGVSAVLGAVAVKLPERGADDARP